MNGFIRLLIGLLVGLVVTAAGAAPFDDQHDVAALTAVLQQPIPADWVAKARALDDQLMLDGEMDGQRFYLVTDARLSMLEEIVGNLLVNMGEDPRRWIVRSFDTEPKVVNAFVTGGQYIYVFTGFLDEAQSQDEIAVVLGHELGHSLLQHQERRSNDWTQILANFAAIAAAANGSDSLAALSTVLRADYSQTDEQEADAIGVAIATRAGYNTMRGVDFFSRQARIQDAEEAKLNELRVNLDEGRAALKQQRVNCEWLMANWNTLPHNQTNVDLYNEECGTYEARRQIYNQGIAQLGAVDAQRAMAEIASSHPDDRSRIAAVAALTDFMRGRRDLDTLSGHEQAYRVMTALTAVDSVLVSSIGTLPTRAASPRPTGELSTFTVTQKSKRVQ